MIVSFDIPNVIVTELNAIAVKKGFANAKVMIIDYLKWELTHERRHTAIAAVSEVDTSDIVIT